MKIKRLEAIIADIHRLERELIDELQQQQEEYFYIVKGKKIQFEEQTRRYHKTLAKKLHAYLAEAQPKHIVTAPVIYACILPALFLDLVVSIYHSVCFRVYGIPLVRRSDYIVIDRHHLEYLNWIEKLNCVYCGYFNGLIAYVQEIAARSEQYWCPIKHAHKLSLLHSRYHKFIDYGDGDNYARRLERLRENIIGRDGD